MEGRNPAQRPDSGAELAPRNHGWRVRGAGHADVPFRRPGLQFLPLLQPWLRCPGSYSSEGSRDSPALEQTNAPTLDRLPDHLRGDGGEVQNWPNPPHKGGRGARGVLRRKRKDNGVSVTALIHSAVRASLFSLLPAADTTGVAGSIAISLRRFFEK